MIKKRILPAKQVLFTGLLLNIALMASSQTTKETREPASPLVPDTWYFNHVNNLYANAHSIGVGTSTPLYNIHCAGNLMVSGMRNTIFFSAADNDNRGDFAIQYLADGLSFWKPWKPEYDKVYTGNHHIFLGNDGFTGINRPKTAPLPQSLLEIYNTTKNKHSILLNRISDSDSLTPITNEIQFQVDSKGVFALGTHLHDSRPNSFFIWNDIRKATEFYIADNGMTGINTVWPSAQLDVEGSFEAACAGIGTVPPPTGSHWKLFVKGGIKAHEIMVTINPFADYVFREDYPLMSIGTLEKFIKENGHLPGIPSEEEVAENEGIELGAMQVKLLEKIEEQALYIIDLQKQIDELRNMVSSTTR